MRDISRGEGNLKREALWGGGDSLVLRLPKILVLTMHITAGGGYSSKKAWAAAYHVRWLEWVL